MPNIDFLNQQNYESTEFILRHNYLINAYTVPELSYERLRAVTNVSYGVFDKKTPYDTPLHRWMNDNIFLEARLYDCVGSTEFVDPDPIISLFDSPLKYVGYVFAPTQAPGYVGIHDPDIVSKLSRSKFGPGTPQTFMTENLIVGWVMYYDFGDTIWILEIQANNHLRGGILQTPAGRTQFYRHLLTRFVNATPSRTHVILTQTDMLLLNKTKPSGSIPPTSPYNKKVLTSAGFVKQHVAANVQLTFNLPVAANFSNEVRTWIRYPLV